MPYKDPQKKRDYMRLWVAYRRAEWFEDKTCKECGTTENLQLHHREPAKKVAHPKHHPVQPWTRRGFNALVGIIHNERSLSLLR